jgi:8-oxo-dGTP pyrophosphatase MutT (NUDIX family)
VQPKDAATVMLVRDGPGGMEVFMLRRNLESAPWGGLHLFPGGAVDEEDRHADLEAICRGRSDVEASAILGVDSGGLAFWVAAVRECFEEAGVLLARDADGSVLSFADDATAQRFVQHRGEVDRGERRLADVCTAEQLTISADAMHYFSHWITPVGAPRRYDTRFFVAAAPAEQVPLHDDRETIANLWVRPGDALDRHRAGDLEMIVPTVENLKAIGRFERSADLLSAAATVAEVPTVLPRLAQDSVNGVRILLPGDDGYDDAVAGA